MHASSSLWVWWLWCLSVNANQTKVTSNRCKSDWLREGCKKCSAVCFIGTPSYASQSNPYLAPCWCAAWSLHIWVVNHRWSPHIPNSNNRDRLAMQICLTEEGCKSVQLFALLAHPALSNPAHHIWSPHILNSNDRNRLAIQIWLSEGYEKFLGACFICILCYTNHHPCNSYFIFCSQITWIHLNITFNLKVLGLHLAYRLPQISVFCLNFVDLFSFKNLQ